MRESRASALDMRRCGYPKLPVTCSVVAATDRGTLLFADFRLIRCLTEILGEWGGHWCCCNAHYCGEMASLHQQAEIDHRRARVVPACQCELLVLKTCHGSDRILASELMAVAVPAGPH